MYNIDIYQQVQQMAEREAQRLEHSAKIASDREKILREAAQCALGISTFVKSEVTRLKEILVPLGSIGLGQSSDEFYTQEHDHRQERMNLTSQTNSRQIRTEILQTSGWQTNWTTMETNRNARNVEVDKTYSPSDIRPEQNCYPHTDSNAQEIDWRDTWWKYVDDILSEEKLKKRGRGKSWKYSWMVQLFEAGKRIRGDKLANLQLSQLGKILAGIVIFDPMPGWQNVILSITTRIRKWKSIVEEKYPQFKTTGKSLSKKRYIQNTLSDDLMRNHQTDTQESGGQTLCTPSIIGSQGKRQRTDSIHSADEGDDNPFSSCLRRLYHTNSDGQMQIDATQE
jgi:hypothetical protein